MEKIKNRKIKISEVQNFKKNKNQMEKLGMRKIKFQNRKNLVIKKEWVERLEAMDCVTKRQCIVALYQYLCDDSRDVSAYDTYPRAVRVFMRWVIKTERTGRASMQNYKAILCKQSAPRLKAFRAFKAYRATGADVVRHGRTAGVARQGQIRHFFVNKALRDEGHLGHFFASKALRDERRLRRGGRTSRASLLPGGNQSGADVAGRGQTARVIKPGRTSRASLLPGGNQPGADVAGKLRQGQTKCIIDDIARNVGTNLRFQAYLSGRLLG